MAADMKEILKKSFFAQKLLDADLDKRAELRSLMEKVSPTWSDMPKSSGDQDKICNSLIRLEELDSKIAADIKKITEVLNLNRFLIDSLERYDHRIILTKRYVNFQRWEDIAHDLNYSWESVHRIHRQALECVAKTNVKHGI